MSRQIVLATCIALLLSLTARAEDADSALASGPPSPWSLALGLEWWNGAAGEANQNSPVNPGNAVFQLPSWTAFTDIRPSAKLTHASGWLAVARPRLELRPTWIHHDGLPTTYQFQDDGFFTEAYVNWTASDNLTLSFGQQNFQWGPAELLGPSNPIFHFQPGQRSLLWDERGHWLARANLTFGQDWSLIALADLFYNRTYEWVADTSFDRQALLKFEYRLHDGSAYFGLTAGAARVTRSWIGEYLNVNPSEGWSIYADARHTIGSDAYYPTAVMPGVSSMNRTQLNDGRVYTLATAGGRFEDRVDARLEFVYNDAGYTRSQFLLAQQASLQPERLLNPGLELPGQHYLYASLRIPDVGEAKLVTLNARYLQSFMDGSGAAAGSIERLFGSRFMAFLELNYYLGGVRTELALLERAEGVTGVRTSF